MREVGSGSEVDIQVLKSGHFRLNRGDTVVD